jgi:hypothetical protein
VSWLAENRFILRRGTWETSGTEKEEVERVPRLERGREVPSAVRTLTGEMRERRADRIEKSEVIWKLAPESRYHRDVPDCVEGGGHVVPGESVTEPAVPVEGEPVAVSRPRRRLIIS